MSYLQLIILKLILNLCISSQFELVILDDPYHKNAGHFS